MADDGNMNVFAKFRLDVTDFIGGLEKSQSGILAFYRDVSVSIGATMFVFDKLMTYGSKFVELSNQASEFVSTLDKLSVTTGLNNEELQRWSNVARYADSDVSTLSASLRKFQLNLNDSGESGEKVRKILDSMGVSYKNADGSLKSMTELFPEAISGIGNLSSSADRVTASNALFGRSYQELAGYMAMSKEEMEGYYRSANVLTEDQQQKLRDYEQACKDLNGTLQTLSYTAGSDLAPSMKEWTDLLNNDLLQNGGAVDTFFKNLDGFLTAAARGFHILSEEGKTISQVLTGDFSGAIKTQGDLSSWVSSTQTKDALAASGYSEGMVWDAASGKWVKPASSGSKSTLPDLSTPAKETKLTPNEIAQKQNELALKNLEIKDAQRDYNDLLKKANDWQSTGAKTIGEYRDNLEKARLKMVGLTLDAQALTDTLQKAGAAATGVSAGLTYNQQFASQMNGPVGPDTAGYSDLANMTAEQLQEVVNKASKGGSKGMAEKAQMYLSLMKSSGSTGSGASGTAAKTVTPGSKEQTTDVKTEYDTQGKALESLTATVKKEYQKQSDAFKTYMEDLATYRAAQYPVLEKMDLIHWATSEEIARVAAQKELDFMAACVNFGGLHPIIQNYIVMSKNGADWTPPAFNAVTAPTLASADFTTVGASVQNIVAAGLGKGTSKDVQVTNHITNIIGSDVSDSTVKKVSDATTQGVNKALAGVSYLGGKLV